MKQGASPDETATRWHLLGLGWERAADSDRAGQLRTLAPHLPLHRAVSAPARSLPHIKTASLVLDPYSIVECGLCIIPAGLIREWW